MTLGKHGLAVLEMEISPIFVPRIRKHLCAENDQVDFITCISLAVTPPATLLGDHGFGSVL